MHDFGLKASARMAVSVDRQLPSSSSSPSSCQTRLNSKKIQRVTSLEHILKEITNFGGFDAETEASRHELKSIDRRARRAKSVDTLNQRGREDEISSNSNNSGKRKKLIYENIKFRDLLVNDNLVIVDKETRDIKQESGGQEKQRDEGKNASKKKKKAKGEEPQEGEEGDDEEREKQNNEYPVPNTVRRFKDIFETMSNKPIVAGDSSNKSIGSKVAVGRSISVRVTNADWRRAKPEYQEIISKLEGLAMESEDRRRTLPGRLIIPKEATQEKGNEQELSLSLPSSFSNSLKESQIGETGEADRDWLNACSPVSPDVIQKLREHGTSMTFFGRPAFSPSTSPTPEGGARKGGYEEGGGGGGGGGEWRKPKIIGTTRKNAQGMSTSSNSKSPSSLCSSSTCSDDELHFASGFDFPSPEAEDHRANHADDDSGHDEDYYSYDVVFLDGAYSRSATPQFASATKGVWLRDPFWSGSSYIVFDFRGTNVQPHVKTQEQ